MPDDNGTTTPAAPAPQSEPKAPAADTAPSKDEVTLLRSRNSGLDAKVTELTKANEAAEARAAAAAARLADYEAGRVGADEALRAQLEAEKAKSAAASREAMLARIEARYPESFRVLGEGAAGLSDDVLAANEARLQGQPDTGEPPTPRGNNPSRAGQKAPPKDESAADVLARLKTMPVPWANNG